MTNEHERDLLSTQMPISIDACMDDLQAPTEPPADPRVFAGQSLPQLVISQGGAKKTEKLAINAGNICTILSQHARLCDWVRFDEFLHCKMLWKKIPSSGFGTSADWLENPIPFSDVHLHQLQHWFQRSGMPYISVDMVYSGLINALERNPYHPVRDYLNGLKWDGVERIKNFGPEIMGTKNTAYEEKAFEIFFVGAVARIFKPGCEMQYMLILEGKQGLGKSTFFKELSNGWFSDSLPHDLGNKDAAQHLAGKWIIEVAEMAGMRKNEAEVLKQFLTRSTEKYRPAYGREEITQPRQCIFVGTTNDSEYLKDDTGNRRFLPVLVTKVDIEAVKLIKDQLWAEAVVKFNSGVEWWPGREFEAEWMVEEQNSRMAVDPWEELLAGKFVHGSILLPGITMGKTTKLNYSQLGELVEVPVQQQTVYTRKRLAAVMEKLGWGKERNLKGVFWASPM